MAPAIERSPCAGAAIALVLPGVGPIVADGPLAGYTIRGIDDQRFVVIGRHARKKILLLLIDDFFFVHVFPVG